jgi:membrane associated rhomboid family serine protease
VFIPLGTDRALRRPRLVVPALIGINAAVFLGLEVWGNLNPGQAADIIATGMLRPGDVVWWNLLSYAFLHGGWLHILGNMLFLWVFGPNLEDRLGWLGFLVLYLAGGIAAGLMHLLFERSPVVGASGAIAAITGAYAVLFPMTMIRCFVFFLVIGVFWIPALWFIGAAVIWDVVLQGLSPGDRVARLAHIGGYIFGGGLAFALRGAGVLAPEEYDLFSRFKQARRRRAFAEAAEHATKPPPATAGLSDAESERLAEARATLTRAVMAGDFAAAAGHFETLRRDFQAAGASAVTLPRRQQRDLANGLLAAGRHALAAEAYERFAAAYPDDPEAPQSRVMLALICRRYLNDPARAARATQGLDRGKLDPDSAALLDGLLKP